MAQRAPRTGTPRTSVIGFRAQAEERAEIEQDAIAAGLTVAAYVSQTMANARRARRDAAGAAVNTGGARSAPTNAVVHAAPTAAKHDHSAVNKASEQRAPVAGGLAAFARMLNGDDAQPTATPPISRIGLGLASLIGTAEPPVRPASAINVSDPAALYELRRIGNNINQIAHAVNAGLPPSAQLAVETFRHLFEALSDSSEFQRRLDALKTRKDFNGAAHPQTRIELPGSVPVHPARSGQGQ